MIPALRSMIRREYYICMTREAIRATKKRDRAVDLARFHHRRGGPSPGGVPGYRELSITNMFSTALTPAARSAMLPASAIW